MFNNQFLTERELGKMLRLSRYTLARYRKERILPFIKLKNKILYPVSELERVFQLNLDNVNPNG